MKENNQKILEAQRKLVSVALVTFLLLLVCIIITFALQELKRFCIQNSHHDIYTVLL